MLRTALSTALGGASFGTPRTLVLGNSQVNLGLLIKQLFSLNEQGFAYDPSDLTTLFQDFTGKIAVTSVNQPVGLILDKSKGMVRGSELVTNGDFTNGSTGWTVTNSDATHIATFADGKLRFQSDTTTPLLTVQQSIATVTGRYYEVTITVSNYVSGTIRVSGNSNVLINSAGTTRTLINNLSSTLSLSAITPNADMTIDSISIKEVVGNHAYQITSSMRPLLQRNATTGEYYLAFDGTDDFLVTNSINFTATDKISLFAGVRKLSDANRGYFIGNLDGAPGGHFRLEIPIISGTSRVGVRSKGTIQAALEYLDVPSPLSSVFTCIYNISGDSIKLRKNGYQVASSNSDQGTGNFNNSSVFIGRDSGSVNAFNGHLYSLIGIGRLTTDAETIALEKAIAKNVGVTI